MKCVDCLVVNEEAPGADRSPTSRARNGEKSPASPTLCAPGGDARSNWRSPWGYKTIRQVSQAQSAKAGWLKV